MGYELSNRKIREIPLDEENNRAIYYYLAKSKDLVKLKHWLWFNNSKLTMAGQLAYGKFRLGPAPK